MTPMTIRFFTDLGHYGAKMGQIRSKLAIKNMQFDAVIRA